MIDGIEFLKVTAFIMVVVTFLAIRGFKKLRIAMMPAPEAVSDAVSGAEAAAAVAVQADPQIGDLPEIQPEPSVAAAPAIAVPVITAAAAPEPLVPEAPRKGLSQRLVLVVAFLGRLVRLLAVRAPRQAGRSLQERHLGRKMAAQRVLQQLQPALMVSRRLFTGGEVIRVATTYRLQADGEWQTCTRVVEPVSGNSYWLAGDPAEDPSIEGFLEDRRRLAHLSTAVH